MRALTTFRLLWQSPAGGDSTEAPDTGVCRNERGGETARRGVSQPGGPQPEYTWRADVDRVLALLLHRVGGVETAVGNVATGVSNIIEELHGAGIHASKEARAHSRSTTVRLEAEWADAGTSNPNELQQLVSQSQVGDMAEDVTPPKRTDKDHPPQPVGRPSSQPKCPIVVDLVSISNDSADKDEDHDIRKRIPETTANRVHRQPRQRVVPIARKLLAVADSETDDDGDEGIDPTNNARNRRYKDPPGYGDATDFGVGEPSCKPPTLQPKTHGVREHPPLEHRGALDVCIGMLEFDTSE